MYLRVALGNNQLPQPIQFWDYSFIEPETPVVEREYWGAWWPITAGGRPSTSKRCGCGGLSQWRHDSGAMTRPRPNFHIWKALPAIRSQFGFRYGNQFWRAPPEQRWCLTVSRSRALWNGLESRRYGTGDAQIVVAYWRTAFRSMLSQLLWPKKLQVSWWKIAFSGGGGTRSGGYPWRYYRAVVNANFEDVLGNSMILAAIDPRRRSNRYFSRSGEMWNIYRHAISSVVCLPHIPTSLPALKIMSTTPCISRSRLFAWIIDRQGQGAHGARTGNPRPISG